ncbi:host specificity factor TipJ family phage tail protein, partial [Salipiger bermudensis]
MPKDLAHIEAVGQRHPIRHDVVAPEMPVGSTIAEIVRAMDLDSERYGLPVVTMIRGGEISVVPLDMWGKTRPKIGTRVEVAFPVRDPGSIALIASLAIPQAATWVAGTVLGLTGLGYALVVGAITIVGTLLVQSLIPPAKTEGGAGIQNYAITGTSNAANPYGVFPTVLGRHRIYPPLTATGFSENAGQDVYYYGRMTFGYGPLALEDLRIGTTPITEFAAAEVELEFRNVDRDLTLAAMPGLAPFVVDRTGEENKPRFKLTEVGKMWTFAPRAAADQVTLEINVSAQDKVSGYTFTVEEAVAGSGSWAQVASFTLQDPVTNHDPLSGLQETRTFTSASYSDGVEREYRVTLTGSTPRTGDYTDNWLTFFSGNGVDAVTITKATATYHEVQPGWRYGTDSMFLYPEDITQDDENALPEPGAPVVRYTREASSAASVDISFSRGLYDGTDDGLESHDASFAIYYQPVAGGIVEEDWVLVASPTYEAKSTTALRYTVPMSFPEPGQYAIKVERTSGIDYSTRDQNRAWVTAIRSMSGEPLPSPEGIAEVAFKIKASDQLNGRLDSLNGIVQQLAPVWDGSAWTGPQPVRHPAWLYAQALRGPQQRRPVADSRLDLDAIKAWADQEPHWTCDYVIDTPTQTAEVLDVICAAGRARRTLSDFRWSVIRDGAAGPVRQTFTPRNSWGYKAQLAFPREIHGFRVKARSERLEWEEDEILVLKDGFTRETATELETLQLAGTVVTADDEDEGNAYRLGRYHLAVAENRPETHTFFADWEHIRVQRGDKIRFVHDVPLIGVGAARIKAITEDGSGNVVTITLDELFDFERDSFRLSVRNVQGEVIFQALSPEDPSARVWTPEVLVSAADIAVGDLVAVEETEQVSAEMLVTGIYPRKDESAKITCVDAVPAILQAATGPIPTYSPVVTNPRERADYGLPPAPAVISAFSDSTTQMILPDLSVRPRIAVQLAPYATRSASEGLTTQLRWREAGSASVYTYGEALAGAEYSLLTGALEEGLTYEGQVRIVAPDGQTRGWKDWPNTVLASIAAPAPPAIAATVTASSVPDAAGNGRRPAIELAWTPSVNRTLRATWEVRVAATGAVVQRGLFAEASSSSVLIADGILPATAYEVHASFVTAIADQRTWSAWLPVTTSDLRLTPADLSDDLAGSIDAALSRHDDALDDAEGAVGDLRDRILASLSGVPTFDVLDAYLDGIGAESLIGAIETSLGPLSAPTSLSSQIVTERERLDLLLPRISDAEEVTSDIAGLLAQFGAALFATDKRISDAGIYVDPESGTVKIAAYEYLEGQVSDVSIELNAARAQIDLKASVAYVNQALSDLVLDPTQIPLLDDLDLRISTAEQTLDAVEGTVTSLTETLTVEGRLVTMTTVTETLDSLQGQITDRVTSATFDAAEARLTAAEQTISAFPDNAEVSSAVEASRVLPGELSDASALMVQEMGERFASDQAIRVAEAQAREDLRAYIDEQDGAVAENVIQLRSQVDSSVAQIEDTLRTRATEAEATAEAVTQLQTDIESADGERAAQADAIDDLTTRVTDTEDGLESESARQTILTASVRAIGDDATDLAELAITEMWNEFRASEDLRAGIAVAASELHTYVEEGQLAEASERLQLGAALEDAVAEIQTERLARVSEDEALAQQIVDLEAALDGGSSSAIEELVVRVTDAEDGIDSLAQRATTLEADVASLETGQAGNATAISNLTTRVTTNENGITSISQDVVQLQSDLSSAEATSRQT